MILLLFVLIIVVFCVFLVFQKAQSYEYERQRQEKKFAKNLSEYCRKLANTEVVTTVPNYLVLDTETTGLNRQTDKMVDICFARVREHKIVDMYEQMINPEMSIPVETTIVNGFTDEMVKDKPKIKDIKQQIKDFVKDEKIIVGYNVEFDRAFLKRQIRDLDVSNIAFVDCLELAHAVLPNLENHKMITVAKYLGIAEEQIHRASNDVEMCYKVFEELMLRGQSKGISIEITR